MGVGSAADALAAGVRVREALGLGPVAHGDDDVTPGNAREQMVDSGAIIRRAPGAAVDDTRRLERSGESIGPFGKVALTVAFAIYRGKGGGNASGGDAPS